MLLNYTYGVSIELLIGEISQNGILKVYEMVNSRLGKNSDTAYKRSFPKGVVLMEMLSEGIGDFLLD